MRLRLRLGQLRVDQRGEMSSVQNIVHQQAYQVCLVIRLPVTEGIGQVVCKIPVAEPERLEVPWSCDDCVYHPIYISLMHVCVRES